MISTVSVTAIGPATSDGQYSSYRMHRDENGKARWVLLPSSLREGQRIRCEFAHTLAGSTPGIDLLVRKVMPSGAYTVTVEGSGCYNLWDKDAHDYKITPNDVLPSPPAIGTIEDGRIGDQWYKFVRAGHDADARWAILPSSLKPNQRVSVDGVTGKVIGLGAVGSSGQQGAILEVPHGHTLLLDVCASSHRISVDAGDGTLTYVPDMISIPTDPKASPRESQTMSSERTNKPEEQPVLRTIMESLRLLPQTGGRFVPMTVLLLGKMAQHDLVQELSTAPTPEHTRRDVLSYGLAEITSLYGARLDLGMSLELTNDCVIEQDDVFVAHVHMADLAMPKSPDEAGYLAYKSAVSAGLSSAKNAAKAAGLWPRKRAEAAPPATQSTASAPRVYRLTQDEIKALRDRYSAPPLSVPYENYCGILPLTPDEIALLRRPTAPTSSTPLLRAKLPADATAQSWATLSPVPTLTLDELNTLRGRFNATPTPLSVPHGEPCVLQALTPAERARITASAEYSHGIPVLTPDEVAHVSELLAKKAIDARGLADDVRDTAWRVGATQTVAAAKAAIVAGAKTLSSATLKRHISRLAESPYGEALLAAAASAALAIGAPEGGKRARLAEELRIKAMADASNEAIGSLVSELAALLDVGAVGTIIDSIELPAPEPTVLVDFSTQNEPVKAKA